MPITAIPELSLCGIGVLLVFGAPCQLPLLAGPEHGRTIPLADIGRIEIPQCSGVVCAIVLGLLSPRALRPGTRRTYQHVCCFSAFGDKADIAPKYRLPSIASSGYDPSPLSAVQLCRHAQRAVWALPLRPAKLMPLSIRAIAAGTPRGRMR